MDEKTKSKNVFKKFSPQFWLVVVFEFFERGSYYGMMSFISVYFTDTLNFPKESVGVIKGVIQPLLYFLPIISGALADRFGYRRMLMIAFALLGGGYFLTSQASEYGWVFAALVVMGFGAGTFKPIISGTIARVTDESNSTVGFGIFYWSINLGAFLFPLFLVPFLKSLNPRYVIIASAICTAAMLIPTAFLFKDPVKRDKAEKRQQASLIQTLANAFEIIYSPIVLLNNLIKKTGPARIIIVFACLFLLVLSVNNYVKTPDASEKFPVFGVQKETTLLIFQVSRNMSKQENFLLTGSDKNPNIQELTVYKPNRFDEFAADLLAKVSLFPGFSDCTETDLQAWMKRSDDKITLSFGKFADMTAEYRLQEIEENRYHIQVRDPGGYQAYREKLLVEVNSNPVLGGIGQKDLDDLARSLNNRSFFLLFVMVLILAGLFIIRISRKQEGSVEKRGPKAIKMTPLMLIALAIWFIPGLSLLGRIVASVIYLTITSLFIIDKTDTTKFIDHSKFLLMILLYSGFWILYFQMFDSVLWYVRAYVDAASLNQAINSFLGLFGIHINWFFDVEHVTVINAGTIIILQLIISNIVKKKKALPTMIIGIGIGTLGMAILAISTNIWVFMAGITLFSIGEMTAHPKFISYIGLVAPVDRKAMYMGYLFLYGVFGSSIGGIMGAKLYVHFVDNLNQPRILWLIFSSIGIFTIIALLLYNKYLAPKSETQTT